MKLMKVLFTPHVEHYTIGLTEELSKYVELTLVSTRRYALSSRQVVVPRIPLPGRRTALRDIVMRLLTKVHDIAHVNNSQEGLHIKPDKLLVTEHGWPDPEAVEKSMQRYYLREREALFKLYEIGVPIVTISNYCSMMLRELGVKATRVIYHGLLENFVASSPRSAPQQHIILQVSRLVPFTEPFVFLDALAEIRDKVSFSALIRGNGPLESEIKKYIHKKRLNRITTTIKKIPFEKMPAVYRLATIYVHTCSREPFGLAILEAMGAGLPVIVPDKGGACEIAGDAALKFKAGDHRDLADKILALMLDSELYEKHSRKSLERSKFFSWKKAAKDYLDLYEKLL